MAAIERGSLSDPGEASSETEAENDGLHGFSPDPSVYHYMVFLPPLSVKHHGHYWSKEVFIAFFLFVVCIALQLSLTIISGMHIVQTQKEKQLNLLQKAEEGDTHVSVLWKWLESRPVSELSDGLRKARDGVHQTIEDGIGYIDSGGHLSFMRGQNETARACCTGASCAGFGTWCCAPKDSHVAGAAASDGGHSALWRRHKLPPKLATATLMAAATANAAQAASGTTVANVSALAPTEPLLLRGASFLPLLQLSAERQARLRRKPGGSGGGGHGGGSKSLKAGDGDDGTAGQPQPVCVDSQGMLSCAAPSIALLHLWGDLDEDGDGLWTFREAERDSKNLGCYLAIPMVDAFRSVCQGLIRDAEDTALMKKDISSANQLLPYEVWQRKAVPKAYFEWWAGLAGICQYGADTMCETLIKRGVFTGALNESHAFLVGGIADLDSALRYCERALRPGGICYDALPGTYTVYRNRVQEICGDAVHSVGPRYQNPHKEDDAANLMSVSFSKLEEMRYVHSVSFRFFMWLILLMWYVNLAGEFQELLVFCDFLAAFPVVNRWPFVTPGMQKGWRSFSRMWGSKSEPCTDMHRRHHSPRSEAQPLRHFFRSNSHNYLSTGGRLMTRSASQDFGSKGNLTEHFASGRAGEIEITEFARPHHLTCVCIAVVRTIVLIVLAYAGTIFLMSNHTLLDLLLNALALAFIFDLDEFLFTYLVSDSSKELMDALAPLQYKSRLPTSGTFKILVMDRLWGFFVIPLIAFLVVASYDSLKVVPTVEALECFCTKSGNRCLTPAMFNQRWWDAHWSSLAKLRESF